MVGMVVRHDQPCQPPPGQRSTSERVPEVARDGFVALAAFAKNGVLHYVGEAGHSAADLASRAIYESVLEATATGVRTPDLGGSATTSEFTDEVISRTRTKIDIWTSLGSTV